MQVRERRVAGAEVVDRDARAERMQAPQGRGDALGIEHDHALGDLERETRRVRRALPHGSAASLTNSGSSRLRIERFTDTRKSAPASFSSQLSLTASAST